ncbi:MAG TPA: winged helix-turn-helix domain-containing protein [Candidatus Acidoferrales bacterium]
MNQSSASGRVVRFGTFEADIAAHELRKNGVKLRLQEQPFRVLSVLLENPDQVVTREELRQGLWPADTFVDFDNGLNTAINKIREALGDSAESPRFIETIPRRGYRFVAPVQAPPAEQTHLPPARFRSASKGIAWSSVAVVLLLTTAGGYLYFHHAPKLTEKDSIVLADFTNTTGDPVFDGALRQGLSIQLEQTPFLRVISGDQVTQTLKMMEQRPDARLTPSVAREVCQRANATVEIEGSIAALGNQYVLGLNAVNCATGEALAQEQVTADGKEKVLSALNDAASKMRSKLGESRASLEKFDAPLDQATTSSLEALQAYSQGRQAYWKSDFPSTISSLQRAVDLDPNFASAYLVLGLAYEFTDSRLAAENIQRAYDLRGQVSEHEKLHISANYSRVITRDFEKTAAIFEQLTKTFARDPAAWNGLAMTTYGLGRFDEAVVAELEAVRLNPSSWTYGQTSNLYLQQDHFKEARAMIDQGRSRKIEPYGASSTLYILDFLQNDQAGMAEQASRLDPGTRFWVDASAAAYKGQLSQSRTVIRSAITAAAKAHDESAAGLAAISSVQEALFGRPAEARSEASQALKLNRESTDSDTEGIAAYSFALAGDTARAERLAANLDRRLPEGTFMQFVFLPAIQAAVALNQGRPQEAIEILRVASRYDLTPTGIDVVYLRGEAYLSAHQGAEAATEFQKILEHRGLVGNDPIGALAHLGLGRAYTLQGDTAKAKAAYQDFLTLWKDADPDIPIYRQAKAEYAKLK